MTQEEKLEKLGEIFMMLSESNQYQHAEMVQRIHAAMANGVDIPLGDIEDLQTLTKFGLLQARRARTQIEKSITEAEEILSVIDAIYSDAQVQAASREIDTLLGISDPDQ